MSTERTNGGTGGGDLSRSEDHLVRYQHLIEFVADAHLVTDRQGVIVESNHAAVALLRCPKEFLMGKPLGLFVAQGHRARFYRCLAQLHGGAPFDEFQAQVGRRDVLREVVIRVVACDPDAVDEEGFRWLVRDVTARRLAEAARDTLLRQLVTAQEDERRRVARELHDGAGQLLTALLLGVRAVRDAGPLPPVALERLNEVQRIADELGRVTHTLAVGLRPTALDDIGLDAALRHYVEDWSARTGVEVQFQAVVGPRAERPAPEVETALYRIVQEALTNVAKHAGARMVSVVLERQDSRATAVVEDDGKGFDPELAAESGRLGLLGMRERVALLGGAVEVETNPGAGTTVIARIPLRPPRSKVPSPEDL